jgi:hypothetical protein
MPQFIIKMDCMCGRTLKNCFYAKIASIILSLHLFQTLGSDNIADENYAHVRRWTLGVRSLLGHHLQTFSALYRRVEHL